jgi:hypothetical protein
MKIKYLKYLVLPFIIVGFFSCSISREDIFSIASEETQPDIEVSGYPANSGNYDFGAIEVYTSNSETFTVENNGYGDLIINAISFVEDVTGFTIDLSSTVPIVPVGESTTFTVNFRPTSAVYQSANVIILSDDFDESRYTFRIEGSGFGTPANIPDINVKQGTVNIPDGSPMPIDFGKVEIGASSAKQFTIENMDTGDLNVYDVFTIPGANTEEGEFSVVAPSIPGSLVQGEAETFTIVFEPEDSGNKSATVTITSDDPDENPYTFTVQGEGSTVMVPDINVRQGDNDLLSGLGVYSFGYAEVSTVGDPVEFTIENKGTDILNINSISVTFGDPFQFVMDTASTVYNINPSGSTTFTIAFSPNSVAEPKSATITIDSDDPDEALYTFQVEGEAVIAPVPDINVKEVARNGFYNFGPVILGNSKTVQFTIDNKGTANLIITSVVNQNPTKFTLNDTTAPVVPPGGSTLFEVSFTPTDTRYKTASIEIQSDDPDENPYRFRVGAYGTKGPEPDINLRWGGKDYPEGSEFYFFPEKVGEKSGPVKFTIENKGTGTLEIESIILEWKHIEDFDLDYDPSSLSVPAGGSIPVTVWFKPTKFGKRETKLTIRSNDPDEETYYIKLKGFGTF